MRFGEMQTRSGLFKMLWQAIQIYVGYRTLPGDSPLKNGTANTALTTHSGKTYALMEANLPFEIEIAKYKFDIVSKGFDDFKGQL
jgi:hypothetical protein